MPCPILSFLSSVASQQRHSSHARLVSSSILLQLPSPFDQNKPSQYPYHFGPKIVSANPPVRRAPGSLADRIRKPETDHPTQVCRTASLKRES
jgi:hypothetical protein